MASGNRGKMWTDEATRTLIDLWSEETIQLSLQNCKTSRETGQVYKALLAKLHDNGHTDFTQKEVISKIKKLRHKYKSVKDQKKRSGNSANPKKEWKFFKEIDKFLSKKHNVSPPLIIDTSADPKPGDTDEDCLEGLIQSYGNGEMTLKKCEICDYEQPIHTDGVHVTEGGAVMVYAEADEFVCPNCTNTNSIVTEYDKKDEKQDETDGNDKTKEKSFSVSVIKSKKKRKTNMEKSLESVFNQFKQCSDDDFARYKEMEEERMNKEQALQMQRIAFESERRREDRQHDMNMLRLIMGPQPLSALPDIHPQFLSSAVSYDTSNSHCTTTESNGLVYHQL